MNICQESFYILKPMNLLLRLWLDFLLFVLLVHKYSLSQSLSGLAGSLLQYAFLNCHSLLFLGENKSISDHVNLPQWTSSFRVTKFYMSKHQTSCSNIKFTYTHNWAVEGANEGSGTAVGFESRRSAVQDSRSPT